MWERSPGAKKYVSSFKDKDEDFKDTNGTWVSRGEVVLPLFETGQCRALIPGEEAEPLKPWGEAEQRRAR
jgi:hypothetical protein